MGDTRDPTRPPVEFSPDSNGTFDELMIRGATSCHVETMGDKNVYIGFYFEDGSGVQLWISSSKKLEYYHELTPPRRAMQAIQET